VAKRWIQKAIKRPGRTKAYLRRLYGAKAFTKNGEIKQSYLLKAIAHVKKNVKDPKRRRSLLAALNLARRLEKMRPGK